MILLGFIVFTIISLYPNLSIFSAPSEPSETSLPKVLAQTQRETKLAAWIPIWGEEEGLRSFEKNKGHLSGISPFWFALSADGKIEELNSPKKTQIINVATSSAIPIIPVLGDELDEARVTKFLSSKDLQEEESEKLASVLSERRFAGVNVSFEHIRQGAQGDFVNFISTLGEKLHQKNLILAVTVYAQRGLRDEPSVHDLSSIGEIADQIRIETYDEHNGETFPGPIASTKFLKEVILYTQEQVPVEKIVVALPTHGNEWWKEGMDVYQFPQAEAVIKNFSANFNRDHSSFELFGNYRDHGHDHELWINDAQALRQKIEFLRNLGINQFSIWRLGGEDPAFWSNTP